jgi:hypothetical protein
MNMAQNSEKRIYRRYNFSIIQILVKLGYKVQQIIIINNYCYE